MSECLKSADKYTKSSKDSDESSNHYEVEECPQDIDQNFMEIEIVPEKKVLARIEHKVHGHKIDLNQARAEKCYLCDVIFTEDSDMEHFRTYHSEIKLTRCNYCMFETEFPFYLNLHYQLHVDDFRLCRNCGRKFESREKYHSHIRTCHRKRIPKEERTKYTCSYCPATYYTKSSFVSHELIHSQVKL